MIDQLWVKYSNGHFGFSVQKAIFTSAKIGARADDCDYEKFCKLGYEVGWRKADDWLYYYGRLALNEVPNIKGHFPLRWCFLGAGMWSGWAGDGRWQIYGAVSPLYFRL
jgi:hypothetical protein